METNENRRGLVITIRARLLIGFMSLSLPVILLIIFCCLK